MEDVAASTGAACHADFKELSSVLKAMNVPEELGFGSVRFSLGKNNSLEEIDYVVDVLTERIQAMRQ